MRKFMKSAKRVGLVIAAIALIAWSLFPLYWTFTVSTLEPGERFRNPPQMVPDLGQIGEYGKLLTDTPMLSWLQNSGVIAGGVVVLTTPMAVLAAYALSRYKFRGRGVFGLLLFVTQMLPETLLIVPLYTVFIAAGLINGLLGVVLVSTAFVMPVCIWLLKGAIDSVPVEIEEAARVDGVPQFGIVWTVVVPLVLPSVAAGAVVAFFYGWDEYLFSVTFLHDEAKWPASVGLASFMGEIGTPIEAIMVGSIVYALPAIVFFWFAQRSIVKGLTAGAVKG